MYKNCPEHPDVTSLRNTGEPVNVFQSKVYVGENIVDGFEVSEDEFAEIVTQRMEREHGTSAEIL